MPSTRASRRTSIAVAAFGTVVEWYDFSLFFYVSVYLAASFYEPFAGSQVLALATGAVGFLFRPLGAMVFGHLGDRIGRKQTLIISTTLIAVSMFGIALMPTYDTWGLWAVVGVTALRCLAGFSVGAEYTGIMVYLMEAATDKRRGLAASWAAANSEVGALLAVGLSTILAINLSAESMHAWGWRALFAVGGLLALMMIPLRHHMEETETFQQRTKTQQTGRSPLAQVLRQSPRAVLMAFLISTVGSATYFLNITYVPSYLEHTASQGATSALALGTAAAASAIIVTPFFGLLADLTNRRWVFAGILAAAVVGSIPAYILLNHAGTAAIMTGVIALAVPAAGWSAVAASAIPEQFSSVGRFSGMAIGYNLAVAIFGGFSPVVVTWLVENTGNPLAPAYYAVTICAAAGIPALVLMRNMARVPIAVVDSTPLTPAKATV